MSAYQAARAAEILGCESLPDGLTAEEVAILQTHDEQLPELRLSQDQLPLAEALRVLQRATIASTWRKTMRRAIDAGELRQTDGKIAAAEFKRWLETQGDQPSLLIEGWFTLHARGQKAPGRRRWTDEERAELRDYRDAHGTKAAARKFGISEARIRQLLPTEKPPRNSHLALLEPAKSTTMRKRKT
jgi:hypothetical protein